MLFIGLGKRSFQGKVHTECNYYHTLAVTAGLMKVSKTNRRSFAKFRKSISLLLHATDKICTYYIHIIQIFNSIE